MKFVYEYVIKPVFYLVVALALFVLFGLQVGCATSLDDLYSEAKETGDWTKVDKREESIYRREARKTGCCMRYGRRILMCECVDPKVFFEESRRRF